MGNIISDRINKILEVKKIKKRDLAYNLGVSEGAISKICSGKSNPSSQTIRQICDNYGVNEDWLLTGEGEMFGEQTNVQRMSRIAAGMYDWDPDQVLFLEFLFDYIDGMSDEEWETFRDKLLEYAHKLEEERNK